MDDCFRLGRLVGLVTALFIATGLFVGCATTQDTAPTAGSSVQGVAQVEKTAAPWRVHLPVCQGPVSATFYPAPGRMDFCGESVPLDNQEVRERFDKEFTLVVYNHAQVYWWLKHKDRYLPWIEERLRGLNLPEDLKYVALAEIALLQNAPEKRRSVDERYDFGLSPESALQYLGELYGNLKSWPLTVTAYKWGEKRIMDEVRAQGERDCYQLMLSQEAERYIFKILAMKAVLSDPTRYGYELPKSAGHR